jgi:hypothetical protein
MGKDLSARSRRFAQERRDELCREAIATSKPTGEITGGMVKQTTLTCVG